MIPPLPRLEYSGSFAIGLLGFVLIVRHVDRHRALRAFPVVFFSAHMRLMAALISILNPNDEASVSRWLGIGTWTLPVVVVAALGSLVFLAGKQLELNRKSWALCFVVNSIVMTIVVLTESSWPKINLQ